MPDNNGWKRDCDKYISVMMTLPPAPEAPLQPDRMGLCLYAKYLGVSAKLTIYIVPICVVVEQKRTHVKLSVNNMLIAVGHGRPLNGRPLI